MRFRRSVSACLALLSIAVAAPAVAVAESHFNRGLADMLAGRHDTGCPALAESLRLPERQQTASGAALAGPAGGGPAVRPRG